jgi:predicted DsbA family dithiol-disulfide isomerase
VNVRIEIWSDVVCPWCYIGKRRLETALAGFPHRDEVEVVWRSFQLDPSTPREVTNERVADRLASKYGMSADEARQMQARVTALAAEEGMHWRHDESPVANTIDAHRLIHLAEQQGGTKLQGELKEALLNAYFAEARNVGDPSVLRDVAVGVGLDPARVDEVLASNEFEDAVQADIQQAAAFGATGVPFFVVDRKFGVSGAQPTELFTQVLERAWSEASAN